MRKIKCSDIVQDMSFYPRCAIDWSHVDSLSEALEAGAELPAIVICAQTNKVVDGIHRLNATMRVRGADAEIEAIEKDYASQREMFLDAIRYNAKHGQPLSPSDRQHCALSCKKFGADDMDVAGAIGITTMALGKLRSLNSKRNEPDPVVRDMEGEAVEQPSEEDSGNKRRHAKLVVEAAVAWHRATSDEEMSNAIDELGTAVSAYLTVCAREPATV